MLEKLKKITSGRERLLKNFGALGFLQVSNYLFPLITLPYIVRVLGPEKYGLINFAAAFTGYLVTISDYGFNLSATKEISINRDNKSNISIIFSSVIFTKIFLGLLTMLFLILTVHLFSVFARYQVLYYITFGIVIGNILFPQWFFQGIEDMKYITIINFIIRLLATVSIFVFIKVQNDFLILAAINSLAQILVGIVGLLLIVKKFSVKLNYPGFEKIKGQLKKGAYLFKSTIAINVSTNSNIFILGLLTNEQVVGYYSAADKIRIAAQNLLNPISQTIYPHVNYLIQGSKEKFLRFNRKLLKLQGFFAFFISFVVFLLAQPIGSVLFGAEFIESVDVLKILVWLPFLISISNVYGVQTMLPLNFERQFFNIVAFGMVINLILLFILIPDYRGNGAAVSLLISEIVVTISMVVFCKIKGISFL